MSINTPNELTKKRFFSSEYSNFYLLDYFNTSEEKLELKLTEETKNIYTVTFIKQSNSNNYDIKCNCPDFIYNCIRNKCLCKHSLFVLRKLIFIPDDILIKRNFLEKNEYHILESYINLYSKNIIKKNKFYVDKYKKKKKILEEVLIFTKLIHLI